MDVAANSSCHLSNPVCPLAACHACASVCGMTGLRSRVIRLRQVAHRTRRASIFIFRLCADLYNRACLCERRALRQAQLCQLKTREGVGWGVGVKKNSIKGLFFQAEREA